MSSSSGMIAFDVGLFQPRCGDSIQWSEQFIHDCLELLIRENMRVLRCGRIPPLHLSGVRWKMQPPRALVGGGSIFEIFKTIPSILAAGEADCDQFAPWRAAELRLAGVPAFVFFDRFDRPQGPLYHVRVLAWSPAGWVIEDPSRDQGMPASSEEARHMAQRAA